MKGEINKDFYCSKDCFNPFSFSECSLIPNFIHSCKEGCKHRHRKYPTPEQFKKEYGEEWKGAVYTKCFSTFCKLRGCHYEVWSDFPVSFSLSKECKDGKNVILKLVDYPAEEGK